MLSNFPDFSVSAKALNEINLEEETKYGAVITSHFPIAKKVIIEPQAVFRIIKHANDYGTRLAAGKLTGMQFGDTIEISAAIPEFQPGFDPSATPEELQLRRSEAEEGDGKNIGLLNQAGFDGFIVGRYISSPHSALNEFNVKQLAEAMSDVPRKKSSTQSAKEARPALLLVFDSPKTSMGRLHLRAFVPTPEYAEYSKSEGSIEDFVSNDVKGAGVVREVALEIQCSPLAELLLTEHLATKSRSVQNTIVAEGDLGTYKERGVAQISELQREVRNTAEQIARGRFNLVSGGDAALKAELLFERIRDQAGYLADLEVGCVSNVDFVRVMKESVK